MFSSDFRLFKMCKYYEAYCMRAFGDDSTRVTNMPTCKNKGTFSG